MWYCLCFNPLQNESKIFFGSSWRLKGLSDNGLLEVRVNNTTGEKINTQKLKKMEKLILTVVMEF